MLSTQVGSSFEYDGGDNGPVRLSVSQSQRFMLTMTR
jgi:hypothetical protein